MSMRPTDSFTEGGANPNIPEEDQRTVEMGMKLFAKYKAHRSKYDKNWMHYYKLFRGDQWAGTKMPRFRQKEVVNMIWTAIQSNLPQQTDVRPKIDYLPIEPSDGPFTDVLKDISSADWDRNNWLSEITDIILDGYLYGTGWGSVGFDPNADFGMGSVTMQSEDPFYIYPDPDCRDPNDSKSEGLITAEPVDTGKLKREHPDHAELLKSDIQDVIQSTKTSINDYTYNTSNTDRDMPDTTILRGGEKAAEKTLKITIYLKPHDTEELEEEIEETDETTGQRFQKKTGRFITKKVYPFGRVITIANGVLLDDTPHLPFQNGLFPFFKYNNYILPRELYGVSEVEQLESPQRTFNKILNASLEIMNLMGNPVWIMDTSSGINPHSLVNRSGLVVEKEPGSEVRREQGVQMSTVAIGLADRMEVWFNNVAGTQDVSQGATPGSVTAASAIEALQEAAKTRIRQKQRNLDKSMQDFAQQYADIALEKYNKPRVFRVTDNEESTRFFRFNTEKVLDEGGEELTKAVIRKFVENSDGTIVPSNEVQEMLIADRFDVRVNTTSGLPFAKSDRENKAMKLFELGIYDAEQVLEDLEHPNKDAILQRLAERQQAEAEAAAAQGV
jgi:hypothetical protein